LTWFVPSTVVIALALLSAAPVAVPSGDEAAVAQATEAFPNAMPKADRAPCEALTVEPRGDSHAPGRIVTKAQCIDAATSGPSRWTFITLADQAMQMVGKNSVVRRT
jgi:hypothetical protein